MLRRQSQVDAIRWLPAHNAGGSQIPSFGVVRIDSIGTDGVLEVEAPADTGEGVCVTGPQPIPVDGNGLVSLDSPIVAKYATGDGTPAYGQPWGVLAGDYSLRLSRPGFIYLGGATSGRGIFGRNAGFQHCLANRSASQSISNGIETAIQFDAAVVDFGAWWVASPNPDRVTITQPGLYLALAQVRFAASGTGYRRCYATLNGSGLSMCGSTLPHGSQPDYATAWRMDWLNVGGVYYGVKAYQDSGGSLNVSECYLAVTRLCPYH